MSAYKHTGVINDNSMSSGSTIGIMRPATALTSTLLLLTALVGGSGISLAQTPAQTPAQLTPEQAEQLSNKEQKAEGRRNQRIERLTVEDGGSRVDEVRVGGQTKSITVKPKSASGNIPEYQMTPQNGERDAGPSKAGAEPAGSNRVWKLRQF